MVSEQGVRWGAESFLRLTEKIGKIAFRGIKNGKVDFCQDKAGA